MIHSIFIVNPIGDVIIEKHYRKPLSRAVLDVFFEAKQKSEDPDSVAPVIPGARHYLVNITHNGLHFIAAIASDVSPLLVLELLHRIVGTLEGYFGKCTEKNIAKEIVIVYEVLEEMIDSGFPLVTELNILKDMIKPPSWAAGVLGKERVKDTLPVGQLSATQWRKAGVKYTQNDFFLDIYEEIDAIIDRQGHTVLAEVQGRMNCKCHLSGMPELLLTFQNPKVMDDVSLHPCVRIARWQAESLMSFVPPDGMFELASYVVVGGSPIGLPVIVKPTINYVEGGHGKFELLVSQKSMMQQPVEDLQLSIEFPKQVNSVNLIPSFGTYSFDAVTKKLVWDVRRLPTGDPTSLRGTVSLSAGEFAPEASPTILVSFKISGFAISGLKVNKLDVLNEKYKALKFVKYITVAGRYQIRT